MGKESYSNKYLLIGGGCAGILVSLFVALCPILWDEVRWDSSITWAGTFCSLVGICLAISQIYGVRKSTEAVKEAVSDTKHDIEKVFSISDLSKYFEIINTIGEDIQQNDYKMALRAMRSLRDVLIEYKEISLLEIQDFRSRISDAVIKIGSDIEYIQIQLNDGEGFEPENALRNLNRIQQLLSEIKAKLKHK